MEPLSRHKVLIVEDDPLLARALVEMLEALGQEALAVGDGEEAVAVFHAERHDLVLMDVLLPGINGFEATRRIKAHSGECWVPVVYLTILGDEADLLQGLEAGGDDYLVKPVSPAILEAKLRATLHALDLYKRVELDKKRLKAICDHMQDAIVVIDPQGVIESANPTLETLLGYAPESVTGQNVSLLMPEPHRSQHDEFLRRYRVGKVESHLVGRGPRELIARRKDGSLIDIELEVSEVRLDHEWHLVGVIRDITERKEAERRLIAHRDRLEALFRTQSATLEDATQLASDAVREAEELADGVHSKAEERTSALQEAYQELTSFTYTVSHDLRSPVRIINGYATMLAEDYGDDMDEAGRGYLARIRASTRRMGDLIDGLLNLARFARTELNRAPTDLSAMAVSILAEMADAEPARRVDVEIEKDLMADADPLLMQSLLQNLLQNAWKFTAASPHARIDFGAERSDGEIRYFVRDNGPGFDPGQASRLFLPFQRLHAGEVEGVGIGLATAHRIVHKHAGRIWAEARPGQGATFFFTLPV
ncbi:MAG: PAS domain S-box protein [Rhodocyclaceae bacterium]|nr:PAS domain S-box protein [Rhodocyclaceae bacterium]